MFKDKLIELRKQNNDTQESLAKKINVSRSLVAKWEQNRAYPTNEDLDNIAKVYDVTYEELMSEKELKKIYGIVSKSSKRKNILIMILSIIFSLSTITLVLINILPNEKIDSLEDNKVETTLRKHNQIINGNEYETNFIGESDKNNFMKNKNLYTWEWFQMYRYKLTDKSSIYYVHYMVDFVSGASASFSNENEYNEHALFNEIEVSIDLINNKNINPIFSWPSKLDGAKSYISKYSSNYCFEQIEMLHGVLLEKEGDRIKLKYDSSEDLLNIIMQQGNDIQWIRFFQLYDKYSSYWNYQMLNETAKKFAGDINLFYMFEINEEELNTFSFNVNKKVIIDSNGRTIVTSHTTIYNCIIN